MTDYTDIRDKLYALFALRAKELEGMTPTSPYKSLRLPGGMPPLPDWFLKRLDSEVSSKNDFVEVTDSHYSHNKRYLEYDSINNEDYDELVDFLLEKLNNEK